MASRALHILACLLLMLLGISERATCSDDHCSGDGSGGQVAAISGAEEHGADHHAPAGADHHCDHCSCLCHMAAVVAAKASPLVASVPILRYHSITHFPPLAPVDPLDHVPLA